MEERWHPVVGYEGRYEVSVCGNVRSLIHNNGSPRSIPLTLKPRQKRGYLVVHLADGKGGIKDFGVHRLVCLAFCGPAPAGKNTVNHIDHDRTNNGALNLEWCSTQENTAHRHLAGRSARGEVNGFSKLTAEDVRHIRMLLASGTMTKKIADKYGINRTAVQKIVRRETWAHIQSEPMEGG